MSFPIDFVWGAAAASYQVEGAAHEDGKGPSVWDVFCRQPGKIADNTTGDVSCDHYHRYAEDARLFAQIGLRAYRFSVSWPRVLPGGVGPVNEKGLDFYDRLVDTLLENGVQPWVTLFHWDYPYALFRRGGWLNLDSPDWFAEYAGVIVDRLSDRVTHWMTLNEPQIFITFGHQTGRHAPGLSLPEADLLVAAHNVLLAHGKAVSVIRTRVRARPTVGAAPMAPGFIPASDSPEAIEAARTWMLGVRNRDFLNTTWFADPIVFGRYPEDGLRLFEDAMPSFPDRDMNTICQPLDFYGVNIYTGQVVTVDESGSRLAERPPGYASTAMRPLIPPALYWGPRFLYERYKLPVVITENGMANVDWVHSDGKVHDPQRIDYLTRYLGALRRAIADGVDVRGYFHWTTTDNFEWALGFQKRFGLTHVDFTTGERVLKDSAYWYRDVIASNGKHL
jgi:beta-glucosidase